MNWWNKLIFCVLLGIQESLKLIQWFMDRRGQKRPWPFNSWVPKICCLLLMNLWFELTFWMLKRYHCFFVRLISYSLTFKCRGPLQLYFLFNLIYLLVKYILYCPHSEFLWSECEKIRTRKTLNTDIFHAMYASWIFALFFLLIPNPGKYGPDKLQIWTLSTQWSPHPLKCLKPERPHWTVLRWNTHM